MKSSSLVAKAVCVFCASAAAAQTPVRLETQSQAPVRFEARHSNTIAVDFPGGTLGQYLTMLSEAGGNVNVALATTNAGDVPLPPIHLKAVTPSSAVRILENSYDLDPNNSVHIRVDEVGNHEGGGGEIPIYRIHAERTMVNVWNVLDLFGEEVSPSDVLTAIENAIEVISEGSRDPTILFHESTGVLIMRGTPRHVETIERLIEELRGHLFLKGMFDGWEAEVASQSGPSVVADLKAQMTDLSKRFKSLEARCAVANPQ